MGLPRSCALLLVGTLLWSGCSGSANDPPGAEGGGSCAATLEYDGGTYTGHGELKRDPATTGRVGRGVLPSCDDDNGGSPDEEVEVAGLADLPESRGVLVNGTVYLRDGLPFPESIRSWFRSPRCRTEGTFRLQGDWLGVRGPEPRYDGEMRTPYRLEVHVTEGPEDYVGTTLQIRGTDDTNPGLGPDDVKTSLWEGGQVVADARCDGKGFLAIGLTSIPG